MVKATVAKKSPYAGLKPDEWAKRTEKLIDEHPLSRDDLVEGVLWSWRAILKTSLGDSNEDGQSFRIGSDIFPKPQIMGFFLHELIVKHFVNKDPNNWRGEQTASEKDLVCLSDERFSVEIKTSSHGSKIFGNRSYAQKGNSSKKDKSGYYLAINFEKFPDDGGEPKIRRIRFGWLDHSDWLGQTAETGQQARLAGNVESGKLLVLY